MSMFALAISCLTTSNSPWFMDLTFQIPMQYYPSQHRTLLPSQALASPWSKLYSPHWRAPEIWYQWLLSGQKWESLYTHEKKNYLAGSDLHCVRWDLSLRCVDSLIVAQGFVARGIWDLSFPTRDWAHVVCIARWTLNCGDTKEVPVCAFLILINTPQIIFTPVVPICTPTGSKVSGLCLHVPATRQNIIQMCLPLPDWWVKWCLMIVLICIMLLWVILGLF